MSIQVGERLPQATFAILTPDGVRPLSTEALCAGRKVVLFAVPGAFTPTCSDAHLPGFLARADDLRGAGIDRIACVAVNDAHVMGAWGRMRGVGDRILMLADGNGDFTRAMGLEVDLRDHGMGRRSRRYAAVVDDGVVRLLHVEPAGGVGVSGAEAVLAALRRV